MLISMLPPQWVLYIVLYDVIRRYLWVIIWTFLPS